MNFILLKKKRRVEGISNIGLLKNIFKTFFLQYYTQGL